MNILKKIAVFTVALLLISTMAFADTGRLGATTTIGFNQTATVTKTAAYTVLSTDSWVKGDMTSTAFTFTLPSIASLQALGISKSYKFSKTDSSTNMLTIASASGDTIGGEASRKIINQNNYIIIRMGSGRDWVVSYESSYLAEDHSAGTVALVGGATSYNLFSVYTASSSLSTANCGQTRATLTDALTATLPSSVANCKITFINTATAASAGLRIMAYSGDIIKGSIASPGAGTLIATVATGVQNPKATAKKGDYISLIGDGTGAWWVVGGIGVWFMP